MFKTIATVMDNFIHAKKKYRKMLQTCGGY